MLYDIAFFIFSLIYLPTLIFKGKLHKDFLERFGIYDKAKKEILASGKDKIWIQAVSVGEVSLCKSLIPLLKERFHDKEIILSTITKTGNDLAKKLFSRDAAIIYFPLDFSFIAKRVAILINPKIYIMIETEIWPNMIRELSRIKSPSILINGRISDNSFNKYKLVKPFLKNILGYISLFCMQSGLDSERIKSLGAPPDRVKTTGNMKFDIGIEVDTKKPKDMQELLGLRTGEEVFVAGSTHRGEEKILIEVFKELLQNFPMLKLLIAPRHIERVGEIERLVKNLKFNSVRVSTLSPQPAARMPQTIFLLDAIGQLNDAYAIAALVFVGGSLIEHGGQNPIEPAIFEKAILFGPHMFNFRNISDIFLKNNAAVQILDKKDLFEKCALLLKDEEARTRLGRNAGRAALENRGATGRNLEAIKEVLR